MDSLEDYLEKLASDAPTPGGGSAAAVVGAAAAALVAMVARITGGNPRFAGRQAVAAEIVARADALRHELLAARPADEAAYAAVVAAMGLPRGSDAERAARTEALQKALAGAAAEPLRIAELASAVLALTERALELENANLASDLLCAGEFGSAALLAAAANVRVNHRYMKEAALVARQAAALSALETDAAPRLGRIRHAVAGAG